MIHDSKISVADATATAFLDPNKIVVSFGLERGEHVADFGAGHGFFAIPMARAVGGDGIVYAIDIQKSVLDIIRSRARTEHLLNIQPVWADVEAAGGSKLKDRYIDFILIANILFQTADKRAVIREAYRILREGGRLAVIEWNETPAPLGPPAALRMKKIAAAELCRGAGFSTMEEFDAGSHHYGLLFRRP